MLSSLFGNGEPNENSKHALLTDIDSNTLDGITLSTNKCLADNTTVNMAWTVTSERETHVYFITEYEITPLHQETAY
ncbi:MAG: hypothetical protein IJC48_06285 [Clostridia bacterium]|nr:hypothetical protein [Clostridia bacterium]